MLNLVLYLPRKTTITSLSNPPTIYFTSNTSMTRPVQQLKPRPPNVELTNMSCGSLFFLKSCEAAGPGGVSQLASETFVYIMACQSKDKALGYIAMLSIHKLPNDSQALPHWSRLQRRDRPLRMAARMWKP
jgi:hypothetical protein